MSAQPIPQFLTINLFRKMIKSTDSQDDDSYIQFVNDSNKKVHSSVFPYVGILEPGSIYWSRCKNAALQYARALHADDIELIEKSSAYMKKYNAEMNGDMDDPGLIQTMKAARTDRTKTTMISFDPRDIKVPLPTQNDIFTFDQFA